MNLGGACHLGPMVLSGFPVTVPADYVGMHFRGWPITNPNFHQEAPFPQVNSPSPNGVGIGSVRLHDSGWCNWYQIETSAGVYDWSHIDPIITAHRQAGRTVMWQILGTPTFYVANSDPNKATLDTYGVAGGWCYPGATVGVEGVNGLTALSNFVTALVTRYNNAGGAWRVANPTLGKGLDKLEIWNEAFNASHDFWVGTNAQLVDLGWTVRSAAKAVDAAITILSPSSNDAGALATWLSVSGSINTTKTGANCCDAIAMHSYNLSLPYTAFSNYTVDCISSIYKGSAVIKQQFSAWPVYITESGVGYDIAIPGTGVNLAIAASPEWRYKFWCRMLMLGAAAGYKGWYTYCWERPFACTPSTDPDGMQKALTTVHSKVAGKTIIAASYMIGGEVSLTFSDSSTLTI